MSAPRLQSLASLGSGTLALALLLLMSLSSLLAQPALSEFSPRSAASVFHALTAANDEAIEAALVTRSKSEEAHGHRQRGGTIMTLAAAYTNPLSRLHHDSRLITLMQGELEELASSQNKSGRWDFGNIDSAPDSAFVLKTLAKAQHLLLGDGSLKTAALRQQLKELLLATAEGVRTGGVHTPNHRWAICSVLAHVHHLYPSPAYLERIEQWLAEGIDLDSDGFFSERSPLYTAEVNLPSLLDLALLLNRPMLFAPIRRALDATVFLFEPNGEVETLPSRRQDQRHGSRRYAWEYYSIYRALAIIDNSADYTAIARWLERDFLQEISLHPENMSSALTTWLAYPELRAELPELETAPPHHLHDYTKVFPENALVRIKRGAFSATIYGGSDWHAGFGHGSGLATNPTFFKMRRGAAILDSIRMAPGFFSTGFFYPQGLAVKGSEYQLRQVLRVPYHQPLPSEERHSDGQYPIGPDRGTEGPLGRYFSRLAFDKRPKDFLTLDSQVKVIVREDGADLVFEISGERGVPVTIELSFRSGGVLGGTALTAAHPDEEDSFLLKSGYASYSVGEDSLSFGPGVYHAAPHHLEGESITWVSGSLSTTAPKIYLTGVTPFRHILEFR